MKKNLISVAIVDDEISDAESIENAVKKVNTDLLNRKYQLKFRKFETCEKFLDDIKRNHRDFHVVLLDLRFNNSRMQGEEALVKIKETPISPEIIVLTAHGTLSLAINLSEKGAFFFFDKYQIRNDAKSLVLTIRNAFEKIQLKRELKQRKKSIQRQEIEEKYDLMGLIGDSQNFLRSAETAMKAAEWDVPVLLLGETGTGKEEFAKMIHTNSQRANEKFIPINCGAIPNELLESELFGHEKGAFTDAREMKRGLFEEANNGTIFLDEIGDMPPELQVKLLRVLQSGEIRKVGSNQYFKVNVRIIAATNKNLQKEVDENHFRKDLYYRLNTIPVRIPNLSDRTDDIPSFVKSIIEQNLPPDRQPIKISPEALQLLKRYKWEGNIRELQSIIKRCMILDNDGNITEHDVREAFAHSRSMDMDDFNENNGTFDELVRNYKRNLLQHYADQADWDYEKISEISGLSRDQVKQLYRKKTHTILI
jgi:DNA-binding NtrC family response regulator